MLVSQISPPIPPVCFVLLGRWILLPIFFYMVTLPNAKTSRTAAAATPDRVSPSPNHRLDPGLAKIPLRGFVTISATICCLKIRIPFPDLPFHPRADTAVLESPQWTGNDR
ncbi:hypothetical protein ASPWEDRAFT_543586 [Aspergillus wentii DTO 134E9]|uniref:Uncharacterized protein n=1 Tax=Aspergillus wentii DTO 134E9 TaxID=1073089 RepID=A0A1L9RFS8_ASPWE|nr:uncharacterized protein ASPWEDRAFT_543586 [Aspergillus wentii DTO 134E9]OJJ33771.1 hypothetical protein ASPWEDRAFT_543586 [Aspergillus wentii DTO 134E9]